MKLISAYLAAAVFCFGLTSGSTAQETKISAAERTAAIEGVAHQIEEGYVFADVGKQMAAAIRGRAGRGEYDPVNDGSELARLLTAHLRAVSSDLHVRVNYSEAVLPVVNSTSVEPSPEEMSRYKTDLARDNFGFRRVEILDGNVGYIRFDFFAPPEFAADTYAAAMAFVADTEALIIDLRENGGSISPDAIPMFATYFFEKPTHLIDLKWNSEDTARQLWTWAHVPGRRYLDKPVYVLTSRRTFSGAEEFAYDLKNLNRAIIVGDTTGGGANPGGVRRASDHFDVFVPFGRVTSPITKTNWEGVGVAPDIHVSSGKAVLTAHAEAVRLLKAKAVDERQKAALEHAEEDLAAKLARFRRVAFELHGYEDAREVSVAGDFNSWSPRATPLERSGDRWVAEVDVELGRQPYKFVVDDQWILDPQNPETEQDGIHVNSVRTVR